MDQNQHEVRDVSDEEEVEFSPEVDQLQPESYEKIGTVQSATEGKRVVVDSGTYTAEAWEIERKMGVFKQLQMARKMRGVMESAAEEAERIGSRSEALKIFEKHKYTMMELTSLTEAVRGRYIKDRYDENITVDKNHAREEARSFHSAQAVLGDVRKKMSWENSEDLCIRERRAEQLARQKTIERNFAKKGAGKVEGISKDTKAAPLPASMKKRKIISPTSSEPGKITSSQPTKKARTISTKAQNQTAQESVTETTSKASTIIAKSTSSSSQAKKSRRCHMCKGQRTEYMSCTYWHVTGNQCKKAFCLKCIRSIPGYDQSSSFCPACVGKCTCKSCTRSREKEKQAPLHSRTYIRPSKRRFRDD